jgi:polysaccharide deacetylase family protein (PEP-CTERM system associated)
MKNALTIDVEDYFQVAALAPAVDRREWQTREYRAERNTDRLLQLFARHRVQATFFVLGWVAERSPALVKRIHDAGHEVASHGYLHQCVFDQSPAEFREDTSRSKRVLEEIVGAPIEGYRAASFSITRQSLWGLDVLLDHGFRYDSSIFPIHHDRYGIPGALPHPHAAQAPSGRTIAEFPMSTASWLGRRVPVSGGGYFRILPFGLTRAGLRQINRVQRQPFTFYLHPWEIDPEQPRVEVSWFSRFRHYTNLHKCEARLDRVLGEFEFASMGTVLRELGLLSDRTGSSGGTPGGAVAVAPAA